MNFTSSFFCLFFSLALPKYLNYSSEYCSRILTICKYDSNQINKNLFLISATPIVTRVIIWSYKIQNIVILICTVRTVQSTVQSIVLGHVTMYCLLSGLYKSLYWFDLLWLTILWYFLALQNWLLRGVTSCRGKYFPTIYFFIFFSCFCFHYQTQFSEKT